MGTSRHALFDEESRYLDRFGLLLVLTIITIVGLSIVDLSEVGSDRRQQAEALAASALAAFTLLLALRAAGLASRWQRWSDIVIVVGVLASAFLIVVGQPNDVRGGAATTPPLFAMLLALLAPTVVARRLLTHRRVRRETLLGAVSVYLLIAVAFFYIFLGVDVTQSSTFFAQAGPTSDLMYFSLTTLTTVGYGDLYAVAQPGRLFANAEAVVGQLYLVTFVGLMIGMLTQQSRGDDQKQQV